MAKKLRGQYSKQTKAQSRGTIKAQLKADMKSGKMKMSKNEVPFGGISKAALKYATRTGARIIADRKGAQIIAEKAARTTGKTSDKVARAMGREAAGPKAKGPGGRAQTTRSSKSLRGYTRGDKTGVAVRTGSKPGQFKNTEKINKLGRGAPERAATTVEKESRAGKMTVRYESPKKLKAAVQARKDAPKSRMADVPKPSRKAYVPRANKVPRRAKDINNLGVGTDARIAKKTAAREQAKATARANRGSRPALAAKTRAAIRRTEERQKSLAARRTGETRVFNDKTPLPSSKARLTADGKIVDLPSKMTQGELRQLKVKLRQAAADPENSLRGKPQRTIDERQPRPREQMTDRDIEIARLVGKRDYSRGEVNPLAQRTVQQEADDIVAKYFRDPRVRAQDTAREKAAIEKAMSDKALARRARNVMNKNAKTFRGKAKK